tara:strand:- start:3841 stop:5667 length:1827 start_codon:yes stop_codon:yes gene_type:complete
MKNGFENYLLDQPISLIVSLLIIFGISYLGNFLQIIFFKSLNRVINYQYKYYSILVGTYFIMLVFYFLTLFEIINFYFYKYAALSLAGLGILNIFIFLLRIKKFQSPFKNYGFLSYFLPLYFLTLFLISASPITHADSLGYHVFGAVDLLERETFQKELLPMTGLLVSLGEIMIAIGFSIGAEQFGSILQFSSLICLIPIFANRFNIDKVYFYLIILSTPIIIFLISSPKPQLFFAISTLIIFNVLYNNFFTSKKKEIIIYSFLICLVLSLNYIAKYSFILSSFLLLIICLVKISEKKLFFHFLIILVSVFFLIILPYWNMNHDYFGTNYFAQVFSHLPLHIESFEHFNHQLTSGNIDLMQIFYPKSIGQFFTILGPSILILFFILFQEVNKHNIIFILITLCFFIIIFFFTSNLTRLFTEGFLWLVYLSSMSSSKKTFTLSFLKFFSISQFFLMYFVILYSAVTLFPGSLNNKIREGVMSNYANGYTLAKWTNTLLRKDKDILLSTHRSISLFNVQTYSYIFMTQNLDFSKKNNKIYLNFLKNKKINKILFYKNTFDHFPFKKCLGKRFAYKKNAGRDVGRNPFNKKNYYNASIYNFDFDALPACLN